MGSEKIEWFDRGFLCFIQPKQPGKQDHRAEHAKERLEGDKRLGIERNRCASHFCARQSERGPEMRCLTWCARPFYRFALNPECTLAQHMKLANKSVELILAERIDSRYPGELVLIRRILAEPDPPIVFRSPRLIG